jgi:raffinose/stachyose/melibiose transport system permease protein
MTSTATRRRVGGSPIAEPGARRARLRRPGRWGPRILTAVMVLAAIIWLLPLVVVVVTSLKPASGLVDMRPLQLPHNLQFGNYVQAWRQASMATYLVNSAIICVIKVPLGLFISALTAFGLSRFRFRLRRPLLVVVIAGSMVPLQIPLIPLFTMLLQVNLLNTYTGLILPYIAFGLPFQVIFLTAFFGQVPKEIDDAARIDGCSPWRFLVKILLPLSRPILASLVILDLVSTWNEFPIALTVLQNSALWTVPLGLMSFSGTFSSQYTLISAAMVIAAIPVIVLYVTLQRYFERGFVAGAVKG